MLSSGHFCSVQDIEDFLAVILAFLLEHRECSMVEAMVETKTELFLRIVNGNSIMLELLNLLNVNKSVKLILKEVNPKIR